MKLGVNIDHVATLRQQRGTEYPSPLEAAALCEQAGADGITIHLREDRRHIQDADLHGLRQALQIPLNLEMANSPGIVDIAVATRPDEVCLVPERRQELTTEGGLEVAGQQEALQPTVARLKDAGIRVSLFIEPSIRQLEAAVKLGAPVVELHTGRYCNLSGEAREVELLRIVGAARHGHQIGLQINAGHGLNYENLPEFLNTVPHLDTLNIGHSIVARAVMVGMARAVREMKDLIQ
ncbi:MAG: pyridoxine 5'-phosphate synthase [Kiritimatiellae bacterium]|nr:pyridoxine 5'-phosphate synthase [Kiritimatiellia bacterium]NLD89050.1 pyridoxine 5'-phosphate synthase [Lentisphaerota bacterium]HPC19702.1 pyridoxine 5'-phosphate synthase [Kiritimatiellia bacterium]HQN79653.1 pyridoxine 5'-phosphate synthase [Kiritimatiellia bacterium]HQQ60244.1 pyridoxine 5'-phosphate synthase [Kiritimatiellia bacterium]